MDRRELKEQVKRELIRIWKIEEELLSAKENIFLKAAEEKCIFHMASLGGHIIIRANEEMLQWAKEHFSEEIAMDVMDGENLYLVENKLRTLGYRLSGEHLRFLYDGGKEPKPNPLFQYKIISEMEIEDFCKENPGFENAFNYRQDEIAVAAYEGKKVAAVAGADKYMEPLWQIGIDTLEEYRGNGLGSYLVWLLSKEIIKRGKTPFYTTWSANLASLNTALGAGYFPVWIEYAAEKI